VGFTLERVAVRGVALAKSSKLVDGRLEIDGAALTRALRESDARIANAMLEVASPGDATRVLCCKDVVQPRLKVTGEAGDGVTRLMDDVAVVTCGPIVGFQEGIIDMSGPGAAYSPFSQLHLVVLELEVVDGLTPHEHEAVIRRAGLVAARWVAKLCADAVPDEAEEFGWGSAPSGLPRIVYVDMMLAQGLLHDTYVNGEHASSSLPGVFDPRVLIDDAVVSGNCVSACDKNTTFHHQNNPVILELLRGHGERWDFAGVVATQSATRLAEKEQEAIAAVGFAQELAADGAIVSKEGFGNPDADLMMIVRGLTQAGIATVAITDEFAGRDGASQSLADVTTEADAVVSTGNANETVLLPPMQTVIGPVPDVARLAGGYAGSWKDDGSLEVELQAIMGATNEFGFGRLRAREV
jgi:glycine reductase